MSKDLKKKNFRKSFFNIVKLITARRSYRVECQLHLWFGVASGLL